MTEDLIGQYYAQARKTAERLSTLADSRYVLLIGSVADGTADEHSDIDLIVLFGDEPSEGDIARSLEMEAVSKFRFDEFHFHTHYRVNGKVEAVLFTPARRIERLVEEYPDISFDEYAELSRYIINGDLLQGDERELSRWQEKCRRVPLEMKKETIHKAMASLRFHFKQGNLLSLAERSDWIMVNRTIDVAVLDILRIVYLLNDQIMIKPKRTRSALGPFGVKPHRLVDRLEGLYMHKNTLVDVQAKVAETASIMDELKELTEQELPTSTD